jgi:hypothetical protein
MSQLFWLIKSCFDEAQKTELMGYHTSRFSKKPWLSYCPDITLFCGHTFAKKKKKKRETATSRML